MFDLLAELLGGGAPTRDNPRGSDGIVRLAIIGGGAFAAYRLAAANKLGPAAKEIADSLWAATPTVPVTVSPGGVVIGSPGSPGVGGGPTAPSLPAAPRSGPCPPFVSGVNYVQDNGDGTFETVIGGRSVYHGDKRVAEATYNTRMGCT